MFSIIIATHGNLADSLKETLSYFAPEDTGVKAFSLAQHDIEAYKRTIQKELKEVSTAEILVLVDSFNGTPFNCFYEVLRELNKTKELITGVNLPMLLTAYLNRDSRLVDVISEIIESGTIVRAEFALLDYLSEGDE